MTADQCEALAAIGPFWWYRPIDESFIASEEPEPLLAGDIYLLNASEEWLSQWGGDYQAIADYLEPLMDLLTA